MENFRSGSEKKIIVSKNVLESLRGLYSGIQKILWDSNS